jgi:hypothetical protein
LAVLALAWRRRGLGRDAGLLVIAAYAAFAASVLAGGYALAGIRALTAVLGISAVLLLAIALVPFPKARLGRPQMRPQPSAEPGTHPGAMVAISDNGHRPGAPARAGASCTAQAKRESLLPGWPVRRVWMLSLLLPALVAGVDAALGPVVVLIGLLIVGPCSALLTGRWRPTAR